MSLRVAGIEVFKNDVIIDQPVNCVRVRLLPVEQGEEQVDPEPDSVGVRGVASTWVEIGRDDHDVEDVLQHHESVGWARKQGQAGDEEAGHADDGQVTKQLQELDEDSENGWWWRHFSGKNVFLG